VNQMQTMRHVADGVYADHPFTAQFIRLLGACQSLKENFLSSPNLRIFDDNQSKTQNGTQTSKHLLNDNDNLEIQTISGRSHGQIDSCRTVFSKLAVRVPV